TSDSSTYGDSTTSTLTYVNGSATADSGSVEATSNVSGTYTDAYKETGSLSGVNGVSPSYAWSTSDSQTYSGDSAWTQHYAGGSITDKTETSTYADGGKSTDSYSVSGPLVSLTDDVVGGTSTWM